MKTSEVMKMMNIYTHTKRDAAIVTDIRRHLKNSWRWSVISIITVCL